MGGEVAQLMVIIVVLAVIYGGVMFWTKRPGQDKKAQPGMGNLGGSLGVTGFDDDATASPGGSRAKKNSERFKLTGRDAEVAAKVLKRMLKQDREGK